MILTIYCIAAYIIAIIYIRYDTDVSIPEKAGTPTIRPSFGSRHAPCLALPS